MEGIEVEDEEDEGEAGSVEEEEAGGCLVGDLEERSGTVDLLKFLCHFTLYGRF
jgi:hypothetical protein